MGGSGSFEVDLLVILESPVDLIETRRALGSARYREAHSHRLVILDVWVLTYNDYLQVCIAGLVERIENQVLRREASRGRVLTLDELEEHRVGRRVEMLAEGLSPRP